MDDIILMTMCADIYTIRSIFRYALTILDIDQIEAVKRYAEHII